MLSYPAIDGINTSIQPHDFRECIKRLKRHQDAFDYMVMIRTRLVFVIENMATLSSLEALQEILEELDDDYFPFK